MLDEAETSGVLDEDQAAVSDPEHSKDVACAVIIQGLGEVSFARVMQYQEDPRKMFSFLHNRCCAATTFSWVTVHSTLARMRYTGLKMHRYIARWVYCSA